MARSGEWCFTVKACPAERLHSDLWGNESHICHLPVNCSSAAKDAEGFTCDLKRARTSTLVRHSSGARTRRKCLCTPSPFSSPTYASANVLFRPVFSLRYIIVDPNIFPCRHVSINEVSYVIDLCVLGQFPSLDLWDWLSVNNLNVIGHADHSKNMLMSHRFIFLPAQNEMDERLQYLVLHSTTSFRHWKSIFSGAAFTSDNSLCSDDLSWWPDSIMRSTGYMYERIPEKGGLEWGFFLRIFK